MRYLFGFMCVLALGVMGCSETAGTGGSGGSAGMGGDGGNGGVGGDGGIGGMAECELWYDCDDGNDCTENTCVDGACESALLVDGTACDVTNDCTVGTCANGACDTTPIEDGTECFHRGVHDWGVCLGGSCKAFCDSAEDCDSDFNDCTADECLPLSVDGGGGSGGNGGSAGTSGYCEYSPVEDGTACAGGACRAGICEVTSLLLPCSEQGIRNAIKRGGGPYTFDCDGPQTVVTEAEIIIDNDVILDGEGNLTIDGGGQHDDPRDDHRVFYVPRRWGGSVELRRLTITGGWSEGNPKDSRNGAGIANYTTLTLTDITVSGNRAGWGCGGGILNGYLGTLTVTNSTVSENTVTYALTEGGGGICNAGTLTVTNSTVSGNTGFEHPEYPGMGGGIYNDGMLTVTNSTLSNNSASVGSGISAYSRFHLAEMTVVGTLVDGDCAIEGEATLVSNGYNIESPGDTCGFDQPTDQVNVSADDLKLGELQDNGGPTETHAPLPGSVAIDVIPDAACEVGEDQRGVERPQGDACDVGAFELEVGP